MKSCPAASGPRAQGSLPRGGGQCRGAAPLQVVRVIKGEASALGGRPCVPTTATSLFVLLNSHGNAHPRHLDRPDCGLDEHYIHFPHPSPPDAESMYDVVASS